MRQSDTAPAWPMKAPTTNPRIYFGLALAMTATAYWGFAYTYFMPVFSGTYPAVSPLVHVHGSDGPYG